MDDSTGGGEPEAPALDLNTVSALCGMYGPRLDVAQACCVFVLKCDLLWSCGYWYQLRAPGGAVHVPTMQPSVLLAGLLPHRGAPPSTHMDFLGTMLTRRAVLLTSVSGA